MVVSLIENTVIFVTHKEYLLPLMLILKIVSAISCIFLVFGIMFWRRFYYFLKYYLFYLILTLCYNIGYIVYIITDATIYLKHVSRTKNDNVYLLRKFLSFKKH